MNDTPFSMDAHGCAELLNEKARNGECRKRYLYAPWRPETPCPAAIIQTANGPRQFAREQIIITREQIIGSGKQKT